MKYTKQILKYILPIIVAMILISWIPSLNFSFFYLVIRAVLIVFVSLWIIRLFASFIKRGSTGFTLNAMLAILACWITLSILELVFMFIPRSHGVGYTLGSKIWFGYYWNPVNSFGYRDKEPDLKQPSILFVGDSFTAGHGINQPKDRFSDQVGERLQKIGSEMNVINLGKNGADTKTEYKNLVSFLEKTRSKPEWVVLQYFGNDIEKAYKKKIAGGALPEKERRPTLEKPFNYSYLANYLYWSFPHAEMKPYFEKLQMAYKEEATLKEHFSDLDSIVSFCRDRDIKMIAVIFPFMQDPVISQELYVKKVGQYFRQKGIAVIDPSQMIMKMSLSERIVNHNDLHASVSVNKRVAEEIVEVLQREERMASSWGP